MGNPHPDLRKLKSEPKLRHIRFPYGLWESGVCGHCGLGRSADWTQLPHRGLGLREDWGGGWLLRRWGVVPQRLENDGLKRSDGSKGS